jgi:hypothetical protein
MQEPQDKEDGGPKAGNDESTTAKTLKRTLDTTVEVARPRTRRAVKEEQMRLAAEEAKRKEAENTLSVRRSHRDVNVSLLCFLVALFCCCMFQRYSMAQRLVCAYVPTETNQKIRLKGTAPTFYRRLQTLFFSPPSSKGFQSIGGSKLTLKRVNKFPPIYVIDNFLTNSDLEYFDEKIESCAFQKSFVDNMQPDDENNKSATVLDSSHRTSTFFAFKKLHDVKVSSLEQRIADLLGCWVHQIEALQLVRYLPGQFFGVHHDLGDLLENDEVTLPRKNLLAKRRLVTLFCYLNTLEKGQNGCTYFPKCGDLRVKPVRGRAVLWSNIAASGMPDPRTIHAGEAVKGKDAMKYGLNIWICEE